MRQWQRKLRLCRMNRHHHQGPNTVATIVPLKRVPICSMDNDMQKQAAPLEPVLEMDDIQGLVIPGFFKPHMTLLGVRYEGDQVINNFKKFAVELAHGIATAKQTLDNRREYRRLRTTQKVRYPAEARAVVLTAVGFTYSGLTKLTPGATDMPSEAYKAGLPARAALLGDPSDPENEGHPSNWVVGKPGMELDALVVIAGDNRAD